MAYFGSVVTSRKSAVRKRVDIAFICNICSNVKFVVCVRKNLLPIRFIKKNSNLLRHQQAAYIMN